MGMYTKLEGPALEAYRAMVHTLKQKALKELKLGENDLVVRSLRPEDIGLTTPVWTFNVSGASSWNTLIDNKTIGDNRFVGIAGFLLGESGQSTVEQLEITRMGQTVRYWQIQDINFTQDSLVWFDDPITIDQNTTITVKAYSTSTDSTWRGAFLGAVVEKKGVLVQ